MPSKILSDPHHFALRLSHLEPAPADAEKRFSARLSSNHGKTAVLGEKELYEAGKSIMEFGAALKLFGTMMRKAGCISHQPFLQS